MRIYAPAGTIVGGATQPGIIVRTGMCGWCQADPVRDDAPPCCAAHGVAACAACRGTDRYLNAHPTEENPMDVPCTGSCVVGDCDCPDAEEWPLGRPTTTAEDEAATAAFAEGMAAFAAEREESDGFVALLRRQLVDAAERRSGWAPEPDEDRCGVCWVRRPTPEMLLMVDETDDRPFYVCVGHPDRDVIAAALRARAARGS